jgi:hypothetical protein
MKLTFCAVCLHPQDGHCQGERKETIPRCLWHDQRDQEETRKEGMKMHLYALNSQKGQNSKLAQKGSDGGRIQNPFGPDIVAIICMIPSLAP